MIDAVLRDVRYACRSLRRTVGFTAAAVATLAFGIGATTAVFSVVSATLIRPLPYEDPDELVVLWQEYVSRGWGVVPVSHPNFVSIARQSTRLQGLAGLQFRPLALTDVPEPEMLAGVSVTAAAFQVLGVPAALGRTLTEADGAPGAERVAVLSDGLWRRRFGADVNVIGRSLSLNGEATTVIGIMPRGFGFPPPFRARIGGDPLTVPAADLWIPLHLDSRPEMAGTRNLFVVGRLAPGATLDAARQEAAVIAPRLLAEFPGNANVGLTLALRPFHEEIAGNVRRPLLLLFGAVGLVVLIACANVANMLTARGIARQREVAVRVAIGATRAAIVRHALIECLLLACASGAAGLMLAWWIVTALSASVASRIPHLRTIPIDGDVLGFAVIVSLAGALVFGGASAVQATMRARRGGMSPSTASERLGPVRRSHGRVLLTCEAALTLLLLIAAGLLARSFYALVGVDPGFDPARTMALGFELPLARYQTFDQRRAVHQQLVSRLSALPGVQTVGVTNRIPLTGGSGTSGLTIDGRPTARPNERPHAAQRIVDTGYFGVMGMAIVRGRGFDARDGPTAPGVAVVNETAARQFWPGEDPIGQRIQPDGVRAWLTIVGIVKDVRHASLDTAAQPEVYWPFAQRPVLPSPDAIGLPLGIVVRSETPTAALESVVRRAVAEIDPDLPATVIGPLEDLLWESVGESRLYMTTMGLFAAFGLVVAASGLYGVLSFMVAQRRREIGVRVALGARRLHVVVMVLRDGLVPVGAGITLGLVLAVAGRDTIAAQLHDVPAADPVTLTTVVILLFMVALCACYVPARRAARVDPAVTLRAVAVAALRITSPGRVSRSAPLGVRHARVQNATEESRMRRRTFVGMLAAGTIGRAVGAAADEQVRGVDASLAAARTWLARLPKAEFHVHLEGAMPRAVLWQLITKYGGDKSVPTIDDLGRKFEQTPFFVAWDWVCSFLRDADDFTLLGREVARDFARQNIRYVEAFFSPTVFRRQMTPQPIAEALRKGLDEVKTVRVGLVADLGRNLGPAGAMRTLEQIAEVRRAGVIGIGLGGFEPQYAHEVFEAVYARARTLGFRTTAHAGETAGAASVWGAVRALRVDRLGHAVRAIEDLELVRYLAKEQIPLELCLTGNVRGRLVDSYASHPVRRYFTLGIPISLNTDDPLFFGNTLVDEYAAAMQYHRFTRDDVKRVIASAIEASWLPPAEKATLLREYRGHAAWNEPE